MSSLGPSVPIVINDGKPRRGMFQVRVYGTPIVTTGPEPRPFPALKALDIEDVAAEAAKAVVLGAGNGAD